MTAGIFARVPRLAVLVVGALLATATLTLAATSTVSTPPAVAPTPVSEPDPLVVPDVRHQAYVFAKGTLEEGGFAWRVEGSVKGFAANVVASQSPAPGTKLIADGTPTIVADGTPTIVLRLERNASYAQEGSPEDVSPYAGRPARVLGAVVPHKVAKPKTAKSAKPPKAVAAPVTSKPAPAKATAAKPAARRKPAFAESGAPAEPLDEITLVSRATELDAWVDSHRQRTPAAVNHWLYQHNWIVTGASFGWSGGAQALKKLIATDLRLQRLWGVGARSEQLARRTLAAVEAKSR
jgi:hypothetical protein